MLVECGQVCVQVCVCVCAGCTGGGGCVLRLYDSS
jgi:hypothetical protein